MIKVSGIHRCHRTSFEGDEWVTFKTSWHLPRHGMPLYLMISARDGGYVELKVHPITFALLQVIVIDDPPPFALPAEEQPIPLQTGYTPKIPSELWEWEINPDYSRPKGAAMIKVEYLGLFSSPARSILKLSKAPAAKRLAVDNISVGISAANHLVEVAAVFD